MIVWVHVAEWPQWSVAVHVRATEYDCGHEPGVVTSANDTVGFGSHASLTNVGAPANAGDAGHSIVAFAAQEIVGAVVSTTVIVWVQVAEWPQ